MSIYFLSVHPETCWYVRPPPKDISYTVYKFRQNPGYEVVKPEFYGACKRLMLKWASVWVPAVVDFVPLFSWNCRFFHVIVTCQDIKTVLTRSVTGIWKTSDEWLYDDAELILDENKHSTITRWFIKQNLDVKPWWFLKISSRSNRRFNL